MDECIGNHSAFEPGSMNNLPARITQVPDRKCQGDLSESQNDEGSWSEGSSAGEFQDGRDYARAI